MSVNIASSLTGTSRTMFPFSVLQYAVFATLLAALASGERMLIVEAGLFGKEGPQVYDGMQFCPLTFSKKGFSIICKELAAPVVFKLNGVFVRREGFEPYSLTGDNLRTNIPRWKSYPAKATLSCIPRKGPAVTATVEFSCPDPVAIQNALPPVLPIARRTPPPRLPLADTKNTFTGPTAVPIPTVPPPRRKPRKPKNFTPTMPEPRNPREAEYRRKKCIVINGNEFISGLATGWTVNGTDVTYQKDNGYTGIMTGNTAVLEYSFIAPVTSYYAVTLDMTTTGYGEHNDVWLRMPTGLSTRHRRSMYYEKDNYVKAFHTRKGRATEAYSVDGDWWSITTSTALRGHHRYTIFVGGRSTQVTVHRIIMFPCNLLNCQHRSPLWKAGVERCK